MPSTAFIPQAHRPFFPLRLDSPGGLAGHIAQDRFQAWRPDDYLGVVTQDSCAAETTRRGPRVRRNAQAARLKSGQVDTVAFLPPFFFNG